MAGMATMVGSSRKGKPWQNMAELKHKMEKHGKTIQMMANDEQMMAKHGKTIHHDYVSLIKIHTNDNPADILTKYVPTETLQRNLQQTGLGIQHLSLH